MRDLIPWMILPHRALLLSLLLLLLVFSLWPRCAHWIESLQVVLFYKMGSFRGQFQQVLPFLAGLYSPKSQGRSAFEGSNLFTDDARMAHLVYSHRPLTASPPACGAAEDECAVG